VGHEATALLLTEPGGAQANIELVFEGGASRSMNSQAKTVTRSSKGPRVFDDIF